MTVQATHDQAPLEASIVVLTPDMAHELLDRNTHNRAVSGIRVERYAADITRGAWQLNGEAFKIAADGQVLNGQHRLLAVVEADAAIRTLLIRGLPAEAQETMDQGRSRSLADVLKLRGETYWVPLSTAMRALWLFETEGRLIKAGGSGGQATVAEAIRTLDRNPDLRDSVYFTFGKLKPWMAGTYMGALHYLMATVDAAAADDFVERLATGAELARYDPIHVLREHLIKAHMNAMERLTTRDKLALTIKAWNAYLAGEEISSLSWRPQAPHGEAFPTINGLHGQEATDGQVG